MAGLASEDDELCRVCGNPSEAKCSRCKAVSYCGPECQRSDWKSHKKICGKATASSSTEAFGAEADPAGAKASLPSKPARAAPATPPAVAAPAAQTSRGAQRQRADESRSAPGRPASGVEAKDAGPVSAESGRGATSPPAAAATPAVASPEMTPEFLERLSSWSGSPGRAAPFDVTLTGGKSIQNAQRVVDVLKERGVCVVKAGAERAFQRALFIESKLLWDTDGFMEAKKGKPESPGSPDVKYDVRDDKVVWMTKAWITEHERQAKALKVLEGQLNDFGMGLAKLLEEQLALTIVSRTPAMLACYAGDAVDGPRYDYHMDNPYQTSMGTPDDKRRLTVIYYISDATWDVLKDGGALQVALSNPRRPPKTTSEALQYDKITISPDSDTLVVFFSHTMYHAVLPVKSKRRRFALSTWFSTA